MEIISSVIEMQELALALRREGKRIGLVPTMGSLHDGHLSLVRIASSLCDVVVLSIFVNPSQFGPGEDYDAYPRDLKGDRDLCTEEGVSILFCPEAREMYFDDCSVSIDESELSLGLCGSCRPGHFHGVATVVLKLFNIVQPDVAVFGQKDAQQARIVERMVRDLNCPVDIIMAPIVREPDGLARSSRNRNLSVDERKKAVCLYDSLCLAKDLYGAGEIKSEVIRQHMEELIMERVGRGAVVDYIDIVQYETLKPVETVVGKVLVAVAVKLGDTRLIDNMILGD